MKYLRIADQSDADGQFPLLPARQFAGPRVALVRQIDVFERFVHFVVQLLLRDSLSGSNLTNQINIRRQREIIDERKEK